LPTGDGTSTGEFVASADGLTVTDTITGLVWQRDGSGLPWAEAQAYCASLTLGSLSGWRLPARMELMTILDLAMGSSGMAIDPTAFPNTFDLFWTSSPDAGSSGYAWTVGFSLGDGSVSFGVGDYDMRVRCVRGSICYPSSRFVVLSGGLVQDTLTNLVWQQQASATTMTWTAAQTYCSNAGSGFRLPTLKELLSIVDLTVASPGPTINPAFPNTPAEAFWTSSPYAESSGWAWFVDFLDGSSGGNPVGHLFRMRCVR